MNIVQRAEQIAREAHAGQTDKGGRPYIEHVERVAAAVADDPDACAVAWLHDVIEDCEGKYIHEIAKWMPATIYQNVVALTRFRGQPDAIYYRFVSRRPLALKVKLADIADNSDESRLSYLDEATQARLRRKYAKAREALGVA